MQTNKLGGENMYPNLVSEVAKAGLKNRTIARAVGVHENTIGNLLSGKTKASVELAFAIKSKFFPGLSCEYLFEYVDTERNKAS